MPRLSSDPCPGSEIRAERSELCHHHPAACTCGPVNFASPQLAARRFVLWRCWWVRLQPRAPPGCFARDGEELLLPHLSCLCQLQAHLPPPSAGIGLVWSSCGWSPASRHLALVFLSSSIFLPPLEASLSGFPRNGVFWSGLCKQASLLASGLRVSAWVCAVNAVREPRCVRFLGVTGPFAAERGSGALKQADARDGPQLQL